MLQDQKFKKKFKKIWNCQGNKCSLLELLSWSLKNNIKNYQIINFLLFEIYRNNVF